RVADDPRHYRHRHGMARLGLRVRRRRDVRSLANREPGAYRPPGGGAMHVGVDVGGTKTDAVLTTHAGDVLHRHRMPTGLGPDEVVRTIIASVAHVCREAGIEPHRVATVGIGIPGAVADGVVTHAVNLKIERLQLGRILEAEWGLIPVIDNDVNVAALGAWIL